MLPPTSIPTGQAGPSHPSSSNLFPHCVPPICISLGCCQINCRRKNCFSSILFFFFSEWFFEVKHSYLIRLLGVYHKLVTCNKLAHLLAPTRSKANKVACGLILPCLG